MLINRVLIVASIILAVSSMSAFAAPVEGEGSVLLRNVTIVDGLGSHPAAHRDVLIVDGRIRTISAGTMMTDVPPDTREISGDGLTVMPGLIDMHVHLAGTRNRDQNDENSDGVNANSSALTELQTGLNAHLYAGVTSVHDMDNDLDGITRVRDEIAAGTRLGPNISTVGKQFSRLNAVGPGGSFNMASPEVQKEISDHLDLLQSKGVEFVKIYAGVSNWGARHIMQQVKARGMKGVADLWCTNLSLTGFRVTEINGYAHGGCWEIQPVTAEWMAANDKFAVLTLNIFENMGGHRPHQEIETKEFLDDPLIVDVMGKDTVRDYHENFYEMRAQVYDGKEAFYPKNLFKDMDTYLSVNQANLRLLFEAGVTVGLGTDSPLPSVVWPGESMHHELSLYVDAGVPPVEAIKMATYNGAKIIGWEDDLGSVEEGKIADLIIVKGEPWNDINDTRNIVHVIKGGVVLDRNALKAK